MCQRRRCTAADNGRGYVDERVVLKGLNHERGVVYTARDIAGENGITNVATPHGQTLTLALFKVAPAHDRPPGVAGKYPPAGFHLVVDIDEVGEPPEPAGEILLSFQGRRVHILAVPCDVPSAGEDQARSRFGIVEYRLCRSRRVMVSPPRD